MEGKITVLVSGMMLGMLALVVCDPLYDKLSQMKSISCRHAQKTMEKAEDSLEKVRNKANVKTDEALDAISLKIDDLIKSIDEIDISKVKGKSKMALDTMKQKILDLKN